MRSFLYLFIAFIQIALVSGQQIILDESYEDWENGATTYIDKKNDGVSNGIDITDVKISNDDINLYIYFDINKEINIQANNNLTIFIDIDNNVSTGLSKNGIGVDLTYSFGFRSGKLYLSNASIVKKSIFNPPISSLSDIVKAVIGIPLELFIREFCFIYPS